MAQTKTWSEMLKAFKQYNKQARERKAQKEGFRDAAHYIAYLEDKISEVPKASTPKTTPPPPVPKGKLPVIHVADVLDASSSMMGGKFDNALKGINKGIEGLANDSSEVNYTYTLCDFSNDLRFHHIKADLDDISVISGSTRGSTALFDAIGTTVTNIQEGIHPSDKVLVNIYTDGQENASRNFNSSQISSMIKELSKKGWTFTFIGTKADVDYANRVLKIAESNTLVYDGSARGLEESVDKTLKARTVYSAKVAKGQNVSLGFYKDIK